VSGADRQRGAVIPGLPDIAGTYILVMQAPSPFILRAGGLGERDLEAGWYLYVGSAFGFGGLGARCGRHMRLNKTMRWHIDYLLARTRLHELWFRRGPIRFEHEWAGLLEAWRGSRLAWPGFGASDCRCPSHLWYRRRRPQAGVFRRVAGDDLIERLRTTEQGS
jgi:Uri superfamily endonuclease